VGSRLRLVPVDVGIAKLEAELLVEPVGRDPGGQVDAPSPLRLRLVNCRQRPSNGGVGRERVGLQRTGTPGKARLGLERTRRFRRLRNWRVGIEARISHLKRSFGLRRTRLRRLPGARTWVGLGIFAYNLRRLTRLLRTPMVDR
jgi:Transposase DDE domain